MKLPLPEGYFTYFSAIAVNLLSYGGGLGYGWSSPALPKLNGQVDPKDNPLSHPATIQEEAWIASLLSLGAMISPFFCEVVSEKIGRKKTLLLFSLPMITGYIIMMFANNVTHFYVARFLIGLTEGCIFATIPVYSAEISEKHNRGTIGAMLLLFISIGHCTSSILGPFITIRMFSVVSLIPCVLFLIIFGLFVPETPFFYVLTDNREEAVRSLKKLRRKDDVEKEIEEIVTSVTALKSTKGGNPIKELFTVKYSVKAFFLALMLMMFQQFTGLIYIVDYTQKIFDSAQTPISGDKSVMLVMLVQLISISWSTHIIDRVSRKILLVISLALIFLIQILMGTFFYLQEINLDLSRMSWLPIACLMLFILAFQLGIGPISYIFPGEIFEPNVKSFGTTLVISIGLLGEFLIATFLPTLSEEVGFHVPFWIFTCTTFAALFFVLLWIPETKGKSFLEIQEHMRNEK